MKHGPPRSRDLHSIQASPSAGTASAQRAIIRLTSPGASTSMTACARPECPRDEHDPQAHSSRSRNRLLASDIYGRPLVLWDNREALLFEDRPGLGRFQEGEKLD